MSVIYLLKNQHEEFLDKAGEWVREAESKSLYRTEHKDEAINVKVEFSVKKPDLRIYIAEAKYDEKGKILLDQRDTSSADAPLIAPPIETTLDASQEISSEPAVNDDSSDPITSESEAAQNAEKTPLEQPAGEGPEANQATPEETTSEEVVASSAEETVTEEFVASSTEETVTEEFVESSTEQTATEEAIESSTEHTAIEEAAESNDEEIESSSSQPDNETENSAKPTENEESPIEASTTEASTPAKKEHNIVSFEREESL